MQNKNNKLALLRKEKRKIEKLLFEEMNMLYLYNQNEAEYLFSGHATELICSPFLGFDDNSQSRQCKIFGVVGANKENGRYCWIYLNYKDNVWKCYSLSDAFDLIQTVRKYLDLEDEIEKCKPKEVAKKTA